MLFVAQDFDRLETRRPIGRVNSEEDTNRRREASAIMPLGINKYNGLPGFSSW